MDIPAEYPLLRASAAKAAPISHPMPTDALSSAKALGTIAAVCAVLTIVPLGFPFPASLVALAPGMLAFFLGIATAALVPHARRTARVVRELRAGRYAFLWSYDADLWQPYVESERRRSHLGAVLALALVGGAGLLAGIFIHADGGRLFGSSALTILLPPLATGAFGGVLVWALFYASRRQWALAREYPGIACLGEEGIYLTGQLRFWRSLGQRFGGAGFLAGPPAILELRFEVTTGQGATTQKWRVPVPPGEEPLAAEAAAYLSRRG